MMSISAVNILASTQGSQTKAASSVLGLTGLAAGPAGLIASGIVTGISAITGIFTHHAQAVKNEAANMNAAVPAFVTQMQMIFAELNAGQFTADIASIYIDQAVQQYYNQISSILKKSGPCKVDSSTCAGSKAGLNPCNAACSVGCEYVESIACKAKRLLQTGGTVTIDPFGGVNSALLKQAAFTLTYGRGPGGVNGSGQGQLLLNGNTPLSLANVGQAVRNDGTVIPYSMLSGAGLVGASQQPSILSAITPQTATGKALLIGALALGGLALVFAIAK